MEDCLPGQNRKRGNGTLHRMEKSATGGELHETLQKLSFANPMRRKETISFGEFSDTSTRRRAHVMGYDMNTKATRRTCGAKTRKGIPCKNTRLLKNGRCKNHGGLSTGPRTDEGKARALANLRKQKR